MNFSSFFITRPIFAGVLSLLTFILGAISLFQLPISEYPEVVPPTVIVTANYPGANPKTIAETVASPLEQTINGLENMLYMSSQSTANGVMILTVTFKIGTSGKVYPAAGMLQQARASGAITWVQSLEPPDNLDERDHYRQGRAAEVVPALLREVAAAIGVSLA